MSRGFMSRQLTEPVSQDRHGRILFTISVTAAGPAALAALWLWLYADIPDIIAGVYCPAHRAMHLRP